jgi:hypothetical protein
LLSGGLPILFLIYGAPVHPAADVFVGDGKERKKVDPIKY